MACKSENLTIGDNEYSVTQWSAEKAMLMKFKLIKMFGASLALLVNTEDSGEIDFSNVVSNLFSTAEPADIVAMIKNCVVGSFCNDKRISESSFTEIFSGDKLPEMYKVLAFVLKVNYADFFKGSVGEGFMSKVKASL